MATLFAPQSSDSEIGLLKKSDILSQILFSIFRGDLPTGTRLKVQHLAAHFGVSCTPVREAIVELAGLGVVELYPNRGAVVAPFGAAEVREIYLVRSLLEVESVRRACVAENLDELQRVADETDFLISAPRTKEWVDVCVKNDRAAHQAISKAAGVLRLQAELTRYDRMMHVVRVLVKDVSETPEGILLEHQQFLQAILKRDPETAGRAMARHLSVACERAVSGLFAGV
ncbi:GntR family transcriptional regulator [Planctomicrobium sp. SH661]|uniref:GntR family transcriptional regulator n=1 Tax=Planctomicrobium sp. SH661 TaxID=3448124 RepID=UPI003F5B469F